MLSHFLALILATLTAAKEASRPLFLATETNVSVPLGRDAQLNCTVLNAQGFKVAWIDISPAVIMTLDEEVITGNPRVKVHHTVTTTGTESWILTLKGITFEDAGAYMCQVNVIGGLRKVFYLSVVVPPSIDDSGSTRDLEIREGDTARMLCRASGTPEPTITWRRENGGLIRATEKTERVIMKSPLVIQSATKEDAGAYLCIANNGVPPSVSIRVRLLVKYRPLINAERAMIGTPLGVYMVIRCTSDAWPPPKLSWVKENIELGVGLTARQDAVVKTSKYIATTSPVNDTRQVMTLQINDLEERDLRPYRCRANNTEGVSEAQIILYEIRTSTMTPAVTTRPSPRSTTVPTIPEIVVPELESATKFPQAAVPRRMEKNQERKNEKNGLHSVLDSRKTAHEWGGSGRNSNTKTSVSPSAMALIVWHSTFLILSLSL